MNEIAAICYIKDDQQHILSIKFGELAFAFCVNIVLFFFLSFVMDGSGWLVKIRLIGMDK